MEQSRTSPGFTRRLDTTYGSIGIFVHKKVTYRVHPICKVHASNIYIWAVMAHLPGTEEFLKNINTIVNARKIVAARRTNLMIRKRKKIYRKRERTDHAGNIRCNLVLGRNKT